MRECQLDAAERAVEAAEAAEYRAHEREIAAMFRYRRALAELVEQRGSDPEWADQIEPATGWTWREALAAERQVQRLITRGELPEGVRRVQLEASAGRRWALAELDRQLARGWNPEDWIPDRAKERATALARLRNLIEQGKARARGASEAKQGAVEPPAVHTSLACRRPRRRTT
jgi:hypothetical protein